MGDELVSPRRGTPIVDESGIPEIRAAKFFEDIARGINESKRYNGDGTDFTITGTNGFSLVRGFASVRKTVDGAWMIRGNIAFTLTSNTSLAVSLSGVTFKTGVTQAATIFPGCNDWAKAEVDAATDDINITFGSAATAASLQFDVEMDTEPIWTD